MQPVVSTASLKLDTVRNTDIEDHTRFLSELAEANHERFARGFIQGMEELTEATGNVVNAGGRPFSWDLYCDMLEKVQLEFDESSRPMLPTLVTSPQLYGRIKDMEPSPEQAKRFREIIEKKKAEHNAKKRTRRLSQQH